MSPQFRPKPIIHGRDHMPGGADPIPGLAAAATGSYEEQILAEPSLIGYWPLDDTGPVGLDHSGGGHDMNEEDVAPTWQQPGPFPPATSALFDIASNVFGDTDNLSTASSGGVFYFDGTSPFTYEILVYPTAFETSHRGGIMGCFGYSSGDAGGTYLLVEKNPGPGKISVVRAGSTYTSPVALSTGEWVHLALTYDGATLRLYFDGEEQLAQATTAPASNSGPLRLGARFGPGTAGGERENFRGRLAQAAVYNEALSASTIAAHANSGGGGAPPPPGGSGVELPPAPNPNPIGGGSAWTGPTDPGGYHYTAHEETAVLYDAAAGRFDVPSRTWIRAPFNTVGIFRRWQPTPGGNTVEQFLPDDRGLTNAARNGILLVTEAMQYGTADMTLRGYIVPEYPILDDERLPDYTGPPPAIIAPDPYARAIRFRNVTTGNVLREDGFEDGKWRVFLEWLFLNPASGNPIVMAYRTDAPYPIYLNWPARPLHKPLPYPTLGVAETKSYYEDSVHNGGWSNINALEFIQRWPAGTKIVLETWQDSPWPLRFSTNTYPHYTLNIFPEHENRPYLGITYRYDPATIDHATGRLL